MDLDVSFDGLTMCTPVYIKMKVTEPFLLSEGSLLSVEDHQLPPSSRDLTTKS